MDGNWKIALLREKHREVKCVRFYARVGFTVSELNHEGLTEF